MALDQPFCVICFCDLPQPGICPECEKAENKWKLIGYTGEECKNCGRVRVELFENGAKICEKCGWNEAEEEYKPRNY